MYFFNSAEFRDTGPLNLSVPSVAKCGQGQNATKIPKFRFVKFWKQIAPFESTGREVSFEWSHHRILSTDSKVTTTLRVPTFTLAVKGLSIFSWRE